MPAQLWWTAEELAAAGLPDLPATKRGVNIVAERLGWRGQAELARRRPGRGGGWEYHWTLLPLAARKKLLAEAAEAPASPLSRGQARPGQARDRDATWAWFDGLPEAAKEKARARLETLGRVEALERSGLTRFVAVAEAARLDGVGERTIWGWLRAVAGVEACDRLAYLAPRHPRGAKRGPGSGAGAGPAGTGPEFWATLTADYLRVEQPSFASCYRRAARLAEANGWTMLPERKARRRLEREVPRVTRVFAREGVAGLERCFPPQTRDRSGMAAMEGVNADCHKVDLFVAWEDGTVDRPQIVAFQDIYSGKILSWRVDHSPNKVAVMAAFGEMIDAWGIPRHCLFDNGHEFANKWLTGGVPSRFRFKIRDDEPLGVLPQLGIEVHWARPARGQSKPIERAFRDFADAIVKDPRFAGAWVGNRPEAKPENYRSKAIPIAEFVRVFEAGVAEHNARPGRRSPTAMGRSFDATFAESYAVAPIRKATEEQRRLWLMGQEVAKLHRGHGALRLHANTYWADWMNEFAGRRVIARFDPEDLHSGAYVYALDGSWLGQAECWKKAGFFDLAHAQEEARLTARRKRAEKRLLAELRPDGAQEVAAALDAQAPAVGAAPATAKVVRPEFGRPPIKSGAGSPIKSGAGSPIKSGAGSPIKSGAGSPPEGGGRPATGEPLVRQPARPTPSPEARSVDDATYAAFVAAFPGAGARRDTGGDAPETAHQRFRRARELEEREAAGEAPGAGEAAWLASYRTQPEYTSMTRLFEDYGWRMFADPGSGSGTS